MNQLFEKKMEFRGGKKRHIKFPYFLARATRLNKLFIKASSYEPTPREKDENLRWQKNAISIFPIFLSELPGSTNFLLRPVLMSQSFGKKINSQKSKEPLFLEFPIFLTGLPGSTNFLFTRRL